LRLELFHFSWVSFDSIIMDGRQISSDAVDIRLEFSGIESAGNGLVA
jgi:hypothetical protein